MSALPYIIGLLGTIIIVAVLVRAYGRRPSRRAVLAGLVGGLAFAILLMMTTVILSREGNASRTPLLMWAAASLILASVRPVSRAVLCSITLGALLFVLTLQHLNLATSRYYTDNPDARLDTYRRLSAREGRESVPLVRILPTAHTWLTGLYLVDPPFGGLAQRAPRDSFDGKKAGEARVIAGIKFCWCPAGEFTMGSPRDEPERRPDEDQVEVTLSRGFWIAKFETTQGQWKRIKGKLPGETSERLPAGDDYPVGNVNYAEIEAYCRKLTEQAHRSGALPQSWEFRLPTEAQWEYACRAGTTTATAFGDSLCSRQANFKGKPYNGGARGPSLGRAAKVGQYPPNAWGLHDMHGNIFEWCRDWYRWRLPGGTDPDLYAPASVATPSENGDLSRVRRGGCWEDDGWPCRSAFRLRFEPARRYEHIGFRLAVTRP